LKDQDGKDVNAWFNRMEWEFYVKWRKEREKLAEQHVLFIDDNAARFQNK